MASMAAPQSFAKLPKPKYWVEGNKLVLLHLRGGCDGLNMLVPTEEAQFGLYQALRPSIGLDKNKLLDVGRNADGITFGLNPALSGLASLKDNLALFPATHCGPGANRSHFYQFHFLARGDYPTVDPAGYNDKKGWMGRYLERTYSKVELQAFDFHGSYALFDGDHEVLVNSNPASPWRGTTSHIADELEKKIDGFDQIGKGATREQYSRAQKHLFAQVNTLQEALKTDDAAAKAAGYVEAEHADEMGSSFSGAYADELVDISGSLRGQRERMESAIQRAAPSAGDKDYPANSTLARQFRETAILLREIPEMEIVHLAQGGYDTHSNQLESHENKFAELGDTLAAFMADLGDQKNKVTVVVMTEFGRTAKQNANGGTDHGNASCWMALGGRVQGGIYGEWPGLEAAQLDRGRYLKQTVDYRDILSEVLGEFIGDTEPNKSFPGYSGAASKLGFMV